MEPLLNSVWFGVSLAMTIILVRQHTTLPKAERNWSILAIAIALLVFVLFAPISMSDDLHQEGPLFTESERNQHVSAVSMHGIVVHPAVLSSANLIAVLLAFRWRFPFYPGFTRVVCHRQGFRAVTGLRAPPAAQVSIQHS